MEQILYVIVHLVIPILITVIATNKKPKSKTGLFIRTLFFISILSFLYLWGQWAIVGSYYLRYVLLVMILAIIGMFFKHNSSVLPMKPEKLIGYLSIGLSGGFFILFFIMTFQIISGLGYYEVGSNLVFPLKNGSYYIASGGSNKWANNHFRDYPNSQQYAIDINKLGILKGVSKRFLSKENTDHYIFSELVYSPCSGRIVDLRSDVADNDGISMNVLSANGKGNYVTIDCEAMIVMLLHLKQLSLMVEKGEHVTAGQLLGLIGNSGFSQEPHLHLQAAKYNTDSVLVGVPMVFEGRMLVRNDLYDN